MESGADRLGRVSGIGLTSTFEGNEGEMLLLIGTLRCFASFAREQGLLPEKVEKPLAEFIARVESDEVGAVTRQVEPIADQGRKPRRFGVL